MTKSEATDFVMPFGKYEGLTLDEISSTEDDRNYLIWLHNARADEEDHVPTDLDEALEIYLEGD